jgi:putative transposase
MPRRALRSYPTTYATDLTDEQWAAIAPLVATPSPNGGPLLVGQIGRIRRWIGSKRTSWHTRLLLIRTAWSPS